MMKRFPWTLMDYTAGPSCFISFYQFEMLINPVSILRGWFRGHANPRVWGIWVCIFRWDYHRLVASRWSFVNWVWYYNSVHNIRNRAILFTICFFNCPHMVTLALPVYSYWIYSSTGYFSGTVWRKSHIKIIECNKLYHFSPCRFKWTEIFCGG